MLNDNTALRLVADFGGVCDRQNRMSLVVEFMEDLHNEVLVLLIEVARRLICEDEDGVVDQRTRDADALLLTARELARPTRSSAAIASLRSGMLW